MSETESHSKRFVILIVVAAALGGGLLLYVVGLPYLAEVQRTRRRAEAAEKLKQIHLRPLPDATKVPPLSAAFEVKLPFDTYSGYFVSNKFEPNAAESFVVITDQEQFDKVFGVAMVMGDKSHRLPKDIFKANIVLAAVKRGKAVWDFKVECVTVKDGVVELRYSAKSKESDSANFACPLVVSIPKGKYGAVRFVEDKKPVKTVEIGGKR